MTQATTNPIEAKGPACINLQMLRASHYIMRAFDEAYRPFAIRATQMPVLGAVARLQPVTIRQVADELESERSVISRRLQVMEKNGWVKEDVSTTGKEKTFNLTKRGQALVNRIQPVKSAVQQRLLAALNPAEHTLLLSLCSKLKTAAETDTNV